MDLSATYVNIDPNTLESVVLAYLPEGEYTLKGSYIKTMAKRKGIDITLSSSDVLVRVVENHEDISITEMPTSVLLAASRVIEFLETDLSLPASCVEATILSYHGRSNRSSEPEITYTRFPNGKVIAYLIYRKDGKVISQMTLKLSMSCKRKVYVAKRIIRMGDTIYPDMIEEKIADVFKIRGIPANEAQILYSIARHLINPGEVLTLEVLKRKPDVYRGQLIIAYVELPGVKVSTLVEVLKEGYIGDLIRARNVSSGKIITGILESGPVLRVVEVRR